MSAIKKPPMDVSELEEEEATEAQPIKGRQQGGLTYGQTPRVIRREGKNPGGGSGFSLTTAVVGAFIGFILSIVASYFLISGVSRDLQTTFSKFAPLEAKIASIETTVATDSKILSNVVNSSGEFVRKVDLNNYALKSDIQKIDLTGYALRTQLPDTSGLDTKVSVDAKIKVLQDQLTLLKTPEPTSGSTTSSLVKAEISTLGNTPLSYTIPANDTSVHSVTFRLRVTNGLAKNIENVQLFLQLYGYSINGGSFPNASTTVSLPTLTSNGVAWTLYSNNGNSFNFTNVSGWTGTGITIISGKYKEYIMSFNFRPAIAPTVDTTVQFSPDVMIDSYDVVQ